MFKTPHVRTRLLTCHKRTLATPLIYKQVSFPFIARLVNSNPVLLLHDFSNYCIPCCNRTWPMAQRHQTLFSPATLPATPPNRKERLACETTPAPIASSRPKPTSVLVSFPDPPQKNRERVWQHAWQRGAVSARAIYSRQSDCRNYYVTLNCGCANSSVYCV